MSNGRRYRRQLNAASQLRAAAKTQHRAANVEANWRAAIEAKIEGLFDGRQRLNVYTCELCRWPIVTVDRDKGVTSYLIRCAASEMGQPRVCAGYAASAFYSVPGHLMPEFEWYRPSLAEFQSLDKAARAHVESGGLLLRRRTDWQIAREGNALALARWAGTYDLHQQELLAQAKAKAAIAQAIETPAGQMPGGAE